MPSSWFELFRFVISLAHSILASQSANSTTFPYAPLPDSLLSTDQYSDLNLPQSWSPRLVSLVLVLVNDCRSDVSPVNNSDFECCPLDEGSCFPCRAVILTSHRICYKTCLTTYNRVLTVSCKLALFFFKKKKEHLIR